jgi:hypothetical protein
MSKVALHGVQIVAKRILEEGEGSARCTPQVFWSKSSYPDDVELKAFLST